MLSRYLIHVGLRAFGAVFAEPDPVLGLLESLGRRH